MDVDKCASQIIGAGPPGADRVLPLDHTPTPNVPTELSISPTWGAVSLSVGLMLGVGLIRNI